METSIIEIIFQGVSTLGFPVAMTLLMFKFMKDEVSDLRDVIAENTKTQAQLKQLIEDKL